MKLRREGQGQDIAFSNLIHFMGQELRARKPQVVMKEQPFSIAAMRDSNSADEVVTMTFGLHAIVDGMARRFGVPVVARHRSTILKHFTGRGTYGSRQLGKRAVLARCIALDWLPPGCTDEDRADAVAGWDWASAHLGKKPSRLVLTG